MDLSLLQRWTRDDWVIPCTLRDASGLPVDLTGSVVAGEFWIAGYGTFSPLSAANGGIARVSDAAGRFDVVVPRKLTAGARGDAGAAGANERTRVLLYKIDTYGRRQTLGVVPFAVFDGAEGLAIDEVPAVALVSQSTTLELIVAAAQGAPGPSSITAAQVSDGGAFGRQLLQAPDRAAGLALLTLAAVRRIEVPDDDYLVGAGDTYVAVTSLTAPRTITLPPAVEYPPGLTLYVADESGACGTAAAIIAAAAGADTIAGQDSVSLESPYQKLTLHSNGTNLWTIS